MDAEFETRDACIACGSKALKQLSSGRFSERPLRGFLAEDPFGEDPSPHLENAVWSFVQCAECGQKFHGRVLNPEWMRIYYNRWITNDSIDRWIELFDTGGFPGDFNVGRHAVERILLIEKHTAEIRGDDAPRVLDFGCGDGTFLAVCACFGFDCVGVEISESRGEARGGGRECLRQSGPGRRNPSAGFISCGCAPSSFGAFDPAPRCAARAPKACCGRGRSDA